MNEPAHRTPSPLDSFRARVDRVARPVMACVAAVALRTQAARSAVLNRRAAVVATALGAAVVACQVVALAVVIAREIRRPITELTGSSAPESPAREATPRSFDIAAAHLFGVFRAETAVAEVPSAVAAPDTPLNLTLTGILFGADEEYRQAIIAGGGLERTYRAGQQIDGAEGAKVVDVSADGVLLEHRGNTEMLRFARERESPASAQRIASTVATTGGARLAANPPLHRRSDFLRLMRKTQEGHLVGFAVLPGPNRTAFDILGLESNDVITGINGVTLSDRGGESMLFDRLAQGGSLTLTVLRSGSALEVHVDADRLLASGG